jgi:[methyl-Co(III) methanol-specific corrinoid protein]:coenzyme M methyltransferase
MKPRDIFLAALRRQPTPRPAVGSATSIVTLDLMEEAGVFFPEAHLDANKMANLAETGHSLIGFDNVMPLFGVWHESSALGCEVEWGERSRMPDCREHLYGDIKDPISIPADLLERPGCAVPLEALGILKRRLGDEVAVLGKVFGPWTLGYHLFGVENFLAATLLEPEAVRKAMRSLVEVSVLFGNAQADAGADALCLGDHCTRDLCSPDAYRDFLAELHRELHERIRIPLILHICGDTSDRIHHAAATGVECFHFDSKVPATKARELAGSSLSLMGGTSNFSIVKAGTAEGIAADVREKIAAGIDIIGPECAVPLDAPWRNLERIAVEAKRQGLAARSKAREEA